LRAFITGIEGFVGSHLKSCLEHNGIEAYGSCYSQAFPGDTKTHRVDILKKDELTRCITRIKPDYIFHLAAQSSVRLSWQNPGMTKKVNVEGTRNVLEAASLAGAKALVISSAEVYGNPQKTPITEEHELNPQNPYAESKLEAEKACKEYDMDYFIARSFTHIGPGQQPIFFCSEFARIVAEIEKGVRDPVLTFGDLDIVRDLTDVRDVVRAYLLMMEKARPREAYNICSGRGASIKEILDILLGLSKKKISLKQDKTKLGQKSIRVLIGSYDKFAKATGWKPGIQLATSLKDMLDYWRKNTHIHNAQKFINNPQV
jgi:GDP-4-dehydro-6-deoxy-D-mannose reductase